MQQHRIISLLSVLVMLIIPVIGWFLVAQPQLAAASQADQQRADMEAQIATATAVVAQLKVDSAKLPELNNDLNKLRTSIPAGVDSDGYIDGLAALARAAGIAITSLTVDSPTAYSPAEGAEVPADPAADPEAEGSEAEAPAPITSDDDGKPPAVVTDPLINADSFVAIPVTVGVTGEWSQILKFVDGLQSSPRLFLVSGLTTATLDDETDELTGTITGYIYAIPTGVEGKPKPISTTVKQMDPIEPEVPETPDPGSTDTPDPDPTETSAP